MTRLAPPARLVSFVALVSAIVTGCGTGSSPPDAFSMLRCPSTTEGLQREILAPNCATSGCHTAVDPATRLDLESPGLESRVVNAPAQGCQDQVLVSPGNPSASFLFLKIADQRPPCGERMPIGHPPLSLNDIGCVLAWIAGLPESDAGVDGGADAATDGSADGDMDASTCVAGQTSCGSACVDTQSSNAHCGACGRACSGGTTCVAGTCACPAGQTLCGTVCVDTQTSSANCGRCGQACSSGAACSAGTCACAAGLTLCGTRCVDTRSDIANCGACARACTTGMVCSASACTATCPAGTTNCGGSCVDTATNVANCGACGRSCPTGTACAGGSCGCPAGLTFCGSACVSTATDASNCGVCGRTCGSGGSCVAGACSCGTGQTLCGSTCVNTSTDPSNCGTCARACPSGTTCTSGMCVCAAGTTLCGSSCVNTSTHPANCGSCGRVCPSGQLCSAGVCSCGAMVSFGSQVQPIFTASCALMGCHAGVAPSQGMSLAAGAAYASLVNVPSGQCTDGRRRVAPGSPTTSYLINKLTGVGMCSGNQMPARGTSIPPAQIDMIRAWICIGAPNN